jgi:hypothetical protein
MSSHETSTPSELDLSERGAPRDGQPQLLNQRLFMQLLAFDTADAAGPGAAVERLANALAATSLGAVIYDDVQVPTGIGLLTWTDNPNTLVDELRPVLAEAIVGQGLVQRTELTMLGRTYSTGYEDDLEFWMLRRPEETVTNPDWRWAVWYPLRRTGAFERLEGREKGAILREHAVIGRTYGTADLAHDVRLACHGLDSADNEFVVGLVGRELHPLSHVVQSMRSTRQTSEYIAQMGPFFVGRVAWAKRSGRRTA